MHKFRPIPVYLPATPVTGGQLGFPVLVVLCGRFSPLFWCALPVDEIGSVAILPTTQRSYFEYGI